MQSRTRLTRLYVLAVVMIGLLSACSYGPYHGSRYRSPDVDPYKLQKSQLSSASQVLREAESLYSSALNDELGGIAPRQIRHAQWYLVRAQDAYQKMRWSMMRANSRFASYRANGYADKVYTMAGKTITLVKEARGIQQRVDVIMADTLASRERLREIGTPQTFPKDYHRLEAEMSRLMGHIAAGREQRAIVYEPRLLDKMRALEVKTLDQRYLSQADMLISSLKRSGISKWAPQSFRQAEASLENARAYLGTNPRDDETIAQMAEDVAKHARHARNIASEVQKLKRRHTETAVLELESYLTKIAEGLNVEDMRHMPLREQAKALAKRGAQLSDSVDGLTQQNQALQARNQELEEDLQLTRQRQIQLQGTPVVIQQTLPPPAPAAPPAQPVAPYPLPEFKLEQRRPAPVVRTQRVYPVDE